MKAEPEKLIDLMFDNKRQYQIPVYQRNYDWKKDNCIALFKDVLGAYDKEKTHFLGTIVQVQQDEESGIKHFIIIDGQQRMTSIYLLLKSLYDLAEKEEDKSKLEGLIYNYSNGRVFSVEDKNKLKLKPIKTDNEQFLLLMSNKYDDMRKSTNIYQNYDLFKTLINSALNDGYSIKNIIKGLEYFQIVMISLNESAGDEPQVVFERINSTGEDLKLADLIRNYVLMTDKDQEELFENYWSVMEEMIGKDDLSNYFITYLIFKLPNDIKKETGYQSFKEYVDKNHISHREILIELKRYSKYYNVFKNSDTKNYSKYINTLLQAFTDLKQTTIYPFLFAVFDDFENNIINEEILGTVLEFFIGYTVRRMVCGIPSNSLRGLYKTMYKRIFDTEDKKQNYLSSIYSFMSTLSYTKDAVPTDTSFKENLLYRELYKNTNLCKYVLILLENGGSKETVNAGTATIEHIMPQNKTEDWRNEIGNEYDKIFETFLHTLGNLTLTGFNSELSDKKYSDKRNLIKQNSKFNVLNLEIIANETWSDKIILKRAQRLADRLESLRIKHNESLNNAEELQTRIEILSKEVETKNSEIVELQEKLAESLELNSTKIENAASLDNYDGILGNLNSDIIPTFEVIKEIAKKHSTYLLVEDHEEFKIDLDYCLTDAKVSEGKDVLCSYLDRLYSERKIIVGNRKDCKFVVECFSSILCSSEYTNIPYFDGIKLRDIITAVENGGRIIYLDNFIGNYNETVLISLLSGYRDKIIVISAMYDTILLRLSLKLSP